MARFSNLEYDDEPGDKRNPVPALPVESPNSSTQPAPWPAQESGYREVRDEEVYVEKAFAQYQLGNFEQALRYYSRALEFNPNCEAGWLGQVRMLLELGELKEAGVWASKSLNIFRNHPDLMAARAVAACRLGERTVALEFSDSATSAPNSNSIYVWLSRGEVLLATRGSKGQFCLEKAKSIAGTNDWFTTLLVSRIYYFYRQYARAMEEARAAMERKPSNPFVWLVLGNCQERLHLYTKAKESYRQALQLDRDYAAAKVALDHVEGLGFIKRILPRLSRIF